MTTTPQTLVENIDQLVSLPDVCIRVNELVDSANYSATRVAEVISQDVDISARLLRLVNSALFGLQSKVDTISRAVAIAGSDEVRSLVMATTAVRSFTGIPEELVNMATFWRHSIMTGVMSQLLATHTKTLHSERLFVMGMLHDVGRLVIYLTLPEKAREILLVTGGDDWVSAEAEEDALGFNHMDVGAELMRAWGLPEGLEMVARHHHRPSEARDHQRDVALVHIAWAVARGETAGFSVDEMLWAIDPVAWEVTGLSPQIVAPMVEEMLTKSAETINLMLAPMSRKRA
ncbi:MAG: HDOD domain-containing protein [Candidatus Thiodiazotropha sp. (ex Monitilora ramsayi)]|nr:HDOD domain-containing protein [Candidatus Thiodiazotropha sp. (ex Monitilora ramsayi)]